MSVLCVLVLKYSDMMSTKTQGLSIVLFQMSHHSPLFLCKDKIYIFKYSNMLLCFEQSFSHDKKINESIACMLFWNYNFIYFKE